MTKPKFVIGIGSQRAGSTLLHRILDECTDIFMHPVKELHYFDTLYKVRHQDVLTKYSQRQLGREINKIISSDDYEYLKDKKYKAYIRANKILSVKSIEDIEYFDLYRPCIMGNEFIGEITPEYMILPEDGIEFMSHVVGASCKIILIARNPTKRFLSAFKLLNVYGGGEIDNENFESLLLETIESSHSWMEQQDQLNDYEVMLNNYKKYFKNVLFISYDNLINNVDDMKKELESFLEVSVDKDKYNSILSNKINAISETGKVTDSTIDFLNERYAGQISFLNEYFGKMNCVL